MGQIYNKYARDMFAELQTHFWNPRKISRVFQDEKNAAGVPVFNPNAEQTRLTGTPEGLQELAEWAINWFGGKVGIPLSSVRSGGGRGGGGGGARGPTAQDIRNQFDIKELANMVNDMNRQLVFEEHPNAMALASQYVDAVVATKGEKKMDFATFVEEKIKATSRFKTIYRQKPEHLSAAEYMSPYLQAASGVMRPDAAADTAIGGAQFGASPEAFKDRLMRSNEVRTSAPFIQGLENRMSELKQVFKG
jgi:hypothetical protein